MIRQTIGYEDINNNKNYSRSRIRRFSLSKNDYSIKCINYSNTNRYFYLFQRVDNQYSKTASVVWIRSETKIGKGSFIKFTWKKDYYYIWQGYGFVQPGIIFNAGGILQTKKNGTKAIFSIDNSTPNLSLDKSQTDKPYLSVLNKYNIPQNKYAIGIGMDEKTTFVEQAHLGEEQNFNSEISYWIASSDDIEDNIILSESNEDPKKQFIFPQNINYIEISYDNSEFKIKG